MPIYPNGFVAGTKVMTSRGPVNIEDLKPGDMIVVQPAPAQRAKMATRAGRTCRFMANAPKVDKTITYQCNEDGSRCKGPRQSAIRENELTGSQQRRSH